MVEGRKRPVNHDGCNRASEMKRENQKNAEQQTCLLVIDKGWLVEERLGRKGVSE